MKKITSKIDDLIVRPSGHWIKQKHFYLRRYIDIFTRGMKNKWRGNLTFVDLFAGPGRCLIEKTNEDVEGSPLISLQYGFRKYIFIEEKQELLKALEQRCKKSPNFSKIIFLQGDCNARIEKIIQKIDSSSLNLVFADPTGLDLHFDTVKELISSRKVDLLLNIQFGMDVVRNFSLYKQKGDNSKLGLFLGREVDWSKLSKPRDVIRLYKHLFHNILQKAVAMYFLLFASGNPKGLDFWRKITARSYSGQLEFL